MQDITDRLARLGGTPDLGTASSDDSIAADLRRGRQALRHRRARRAGVGVAGVAAVTAVASLAAAGTSSPTSPKAAGSTPPVAPTSANPAPSHSSTTPAVQQPAIALVAYHGKQRPGFTVRYVPAGYVLQGVSGSTLDIARAGDHTPLDTFSGKLTVGIEEADGGQTMSAYHGKAVKIHGRPGIISTDDTGVTQLVFDEGHHSDNVVIVQSWSNIRLTQAQVINFAEGVTVTSAAQRQHG